jgi:hypothetical protein
VTIVTFPLSVEVDPIFNLACPVSRSPIVYSPLSGNDPLQQGPDIRSTIRFWDGSQTSRWERGVIWTIEGFALLLKDNRIRRLICHATKSEKVTAAHGIVGKHGVRRPVANLTPGCRLPYCPTGHVNGVLHALLNHHRFTRNRSFPSWPGKSSKACAKS